MQRILVLLLVCVTLGLKAAEVAPLTPIEFQQKLEKLAKESGYKVGIAIKDLTDGKEFLVNPDGVFPQGSCIRIHIVTELFRQAAAGKVSLTAAQPVPDSARTGGFGILRYMDAKTLTMSLRDYAALMMMVNDNTAANLLTDLLGMETINASLIAQVTPELKFQRRAISRRTAPANLPENVGTPRAAMKALQLIYEGQIVDRATSREILDLLALPSATFIQVELPENTRFAGESAANSTMRCEEGIVLLKDRPYIFCVMFTHPPVYNRGESRQRSQKDEFVERVSRTTLAYFRQQNSAKKSD
jgi:beta-lactamase class A